MNIKEAIEGRRSIRNYTDKQIGMDTLERLIDFGIKAPTGSGMQPWGFVILHNKDEINALSEQIKKKIRENIQDYPEFSQYESWLRNEKYNIFNHAGTVLVIYGDTASPWRVYDCTLAAGNIMLLAQDEGIGCCWIGFAQALFNTPEFKKAHNVPESFELVSTLSMGYTESKLKPCTRRPARIFSR